MRTQVFIESFDLMRSFVLQNLGHYDPTATLFADHFTKAFATRGGVCITTIQAVSGGVEIECEGPDAESIHAELLASFAIDDGYSTFSPQHPLLSRLHRSQPGLRFVRVPWLFDLACSAVLQQRVRSTDAMKDWRHIAEKHGTKNCCGMTVFPSAAKIASLQSWELESLGIDQKRARTLIALAREIKMNPLRSSMTFLQLRARLARIPGIGPWTVETVLGFGAADPDALPLGDLHLPHLVCYALAGQPRGTDERMVELLEPFRGQRFRVVRLLYGSRIAVPRTSSPRR